MTSKTVDTERKFRKGSFTLYYNLSGPHLEKMLPVVITAVISSLDYQKVVLDCLIETL